MRHQPKGLIKIISYQQYIAMMETQLQYIIKHKQGFVVLCFDGTVIMLSVIWGIHVID